MIPQGIIVLDKASGLSSNRAMGRLKRLLDIRKMGFLGTLDPLATGVLPVFLGKATKLIPAFEGCDKTYQVGIRLGERTDTFDSESAVTERKEIDHLNPDDVHQAIAGFEGTHEQTAPPYSALKHQGVRSYRLARQGLPVPRRQRTVHLQELTVVRMALPAVVFEVTCSSGTYMRSLAEDIGQVLAVGAHVTSLRRTRCGSWFGVEASWTLDRIEACVEAGGFEFVCNPADFLDDYTPVCVADSQIENLRQGRPIPVVPPPEPPQAAVKAKAVSSGGTLLAIGEAVPQQRGEWGFQPTRVLV